MVTISELVDEGDIPEERKHVVKDLLDALGYATSRAVGKAFLKITKTDLTDVGISIADANAILVEVESLQGVLLLQTGPSLHHPGHRNFSQLCFLPHTCWPGPRHGLCR